LPNEGVAEPIRVAVVLGGRDEAAVERLAEQGEHVVPNERWQPAQHGEGKLAADDGRDAQHLPAGLRPLAEAVRDQLANAVRDARDHRRAARFEKPYRLDHEERMTLGLVVQTPGEGAAA